MPLMPCPECSASVSTEAISCPACGRPLRPDPAVLALRGYHKRFVRNGLVFCAISLPICLVIAPPAAILSALGMVVTGTKLVLIDRRIKADNRRFSLADGGAARNASNREHDEAPKSSTSP